MAADDRSAPAMRLSPSTSEPIVGGETQTASFQVGAMRIDLSAAPGAARLVVAAGLDRDIYVVDPGALAAWAQATRKLLSLEPADRTAHAAEFRAPYLIDREGRASIAVEGMVAAEAVTYRLLVTGASARIAGFMISAELIRGITDAAAGAASVARSPTG